MWGMKDSCDSSDAQLSLRLTLGLYVSHLLARHIRRGAALELYIFSLTGTLAIVCRYAKVPRSTSVGYCLVGMGYFRILAHLNGIEGFEVKV